MPSKLFDRTFTKPATKADRYGRPGVASAQQLTAGELNEIADLSEDVYNALNKATVSEAGKYAFRKTSNGRVQISVHGGRFQTIGREESKVFNVLDYDADPTGVADSTTAIQNAITAARAAPTGATVGYNVYLPAGTYRVTGTLLVRGVRPFRLYGDGRAATLIQWDGAVGDDVLRVENSQYVEFSDFEIRGTTNVSKRPRACIHLSFDDVAYEYVPFNASLRRLWLGGVGANSGSPNMCDFGVLIDKGGSTLDYNNSEHELENVDIECCSAAGVKINQTQAKTITFRRCNIGTSSKGVHCLKGAFYWYNGNINCVLPDKEGICFELGTPNDQVVIDGLQSEGTGRLLRTNGGVFGGSGWPITIRNSRFSGDLANPDGVILEHTFRGPLVVESNLFDAWDPVGGVPLQFSLSASGASPKSSCHIRNNEINGTDSVNYSLIKDSSSAGVREEGNIYIDSGLGSFMPRLHSGVLTFTAGESSKAHTFEVPTHFLTGSTVAYTISAIVSARGGGATAQVLTVTKSKTGFTVELTAALGVGESLSVDWQLAWR